MSPKLATEYVKLGIHDATSRTQGLCRSYPPPPSFVFRYQSKNLLAFRSLVSEVRSADRDLVEAILASMFMYAQAKRNRDDGWELSHQLPFLYDPDVALGIAVKTYFDDLLPNDPDKQKKLEIFPGTYVPYAEAFAEDLDIACSFFEALYAGVKTLDSKEMPAVDRITWDKAAKYLASRR